MKFDLALNRLLPNLGEQRRKRDKHETRAARQGMGLAKMTSVCVQEKM